MLNILGIKLHPAIGLLIGAALIVAGLVAARPALSVIGAVVVVATAMHRRDAPPDDPGRRPRSGEG